MYEMTLADCLFMKKHRFLFLASLMALVLLGGMAVVACSNNFKHVPRTGFMTHQVKNCDYHIPFDAYWNADDKKIWNDKVNGVDGKKVLMAVVPVDTVHMDVRPDTAEGFDALHRLAEYFRKSVTASMEKEVAENPHFEMVPPGTRGAYTLELAIISISPWRGACGTKKAASSPNLRIMRKTTAPCWAWISRILKNTPTTSAPLTNGPVKLRMCIPLRTGTGRRSA